MVKRGKQNTDKDSKHPRTRSVRKKKIAIILTVGAILVAGAISYGVWVYLKGTHESSLGAEQPLTKREALHNELIDSVVVGDQGERDTALQKAVDGAKDDEQRAELYLDRAAYLFYSEDVSDEVKGQALVDAQKSYQLHATGAAAKTILDIATSLNRQDLIVKYQSIFDTYVKDIKDLREGEGR